MRGIRFRVVLPIVFGFLAIVLFAWDYENDRVVELMGMGWDTGPPMWPYRAVQLISYALNAPAYVISWPILKLIDPRAQWVQYAVWFPAITAMWWWVGARIDFGLLSRPSYSHPKLVAALLLGGALVLLVLSVCVGVGEFRRFQVYWPGHPPIYAILLLRAVGPILWCLSFAGVFVRWAIHLWVRPRPVCPPSVPG